MLLAYAIPITMHSVREGLQCPCKGLIVFSPSLPCLAIKVCSDEEETEPEPRLRDTPEDLSLEAAANTIACHPNQAIIAAGDVDGDVYV